MTRLVSLALVLALPSLVLRAQPLVDLADSPSAKQRATVQTALNTTAVVPGQKAVLAVVFDIAPSYHSQSHAPLDPNLIPTEVSLAPHPAITAQPPVYPPGQIVTYPALGKLSVYSNRVIFFIPLTISATAAPGPLKFTGELNYQICDESSCFPPETTPFTVETEILTPASTLQPNRPELFRSYDPSATSQPRAPGQFWIILTKFAAAFLAGILFNVMPCVLPVLPLKALSFYEVSQHRRDKCLFLGLVFSLGVIAFFAGIAIVILFLKSLTWGEQFSNPYFLWGIVLILVLMAAGMFGLFNFNLPSGVYAFTPRHDTYTGNFLFGAFTALLSTPCTAPLFPPLMAWAAAQTLAIGIPAVMMVGVGMAFPYLLLSAFPQLAQNFPRTGPWSELVKQMMGFLLLVAAVYFAAGQLIAGASFWYAVLAVTAIACLFLLARTIQISNNALPVAISSTLAVAAFAIVLWQASAVGHGSWTPYSQDAFNEARTQGKIVLVKFTANWCANCQVVESTVFGDPKTWNALQQAGAVTLKADMTHKNPDAQKLLIQLNPTGGIPLTAIFSPKLESPITLDSVYTTDSLLQALSQAKATSTAKP